MISFDEYFATSHLVRHLLNLRMACCRKRSQRDFWVRLGLPPPQKNNISLETSKYLPGRDDWPRPKKNLRVENGADLAKRTALKNMVHRHLYDEGAVDSPWALKLNRLCDQIHHQVCNEESFRFAPPNPLPVLKDNRKSPAVYRVLAVPASLEDRLVSGLLSEYLVARFDHTLSPSCYSFRRNRLTYNQAVLDLQIYRESHSGPLYVAECDIRGFYDNISHDVALDRILSLAKSGCEDPLDPRAVSLLKQRVKGYSFSGYALEAARENLKNSGRLGVIDSLKQDEMPERMARTPASSIGLAQGDPLSPLIANAVLSDVDAIVVKQLGETGFYARYCDDVIIIHPDQDVCNQALERYMEEVDKLGLPYHPPVQPEQRYTAQHFQHKSQYAFEWANHRTTHSAKPWAQFLGYQIRHDGVLRVRQKSIQKQKDKIRLLIGQATDSVKKLKRDPESSCYPIKGRKVYHRVAGRIIRGGVGDRPFRDRPETSSEPCWMDAFPLLERNPVTEQQMKELDQYRDNMLHGFRRFLKENTEWPDLKEGEKERYYGHPYSYFSALDNPERQEAVPLIQQVYNL